MNKLLRSKPTFAPAAHWYFFHFHPGNEKRKILMILRAAA